MVDEDTQKEQHMAAVRFWDIQTELRQRCDVLGEGDTKKTRRKGFLALEQLTALWLASQRVGCYDISKAPALVYDFKSLEVRRDVCDLELVDFLADMQTKAESKGKTVNDIKFSTYLDDRLYVWCSWAEFVTFMNDYLAD